MPTVFDIAGREYERPSREPSERSGLRYSKYAAEKWQAIESRTILTTEANELAAQMHDRMPVILSPNDYAEWLDPLAKEPGKLLTPFPASEMSAIPVNPIVNNARNEGPECFEPVVEHQCGW